METSHGGEAFGAIAAIVFMIVFYGGFFLVMMGTFVLWIVALVDAIRREFQDHNEKLMWVLVICLAQFIGAIVYLVVGRKKGWLPGEGHMPPPPPDPSLWGGSHGGG